MAQKQSRVKNLGQLKWDRRKLSMDLWGWAEVQGEFANVFGAQCEEDREESAPGHGHFAWEV